MNEENYKFIKIISNDLYTISKLYYHYPTNSFQIIKTLYNLNEKKNF